MTTRKKTLGPVAKTVEAANDDATQQLADVAPEAAPTDIPQEMEKRFAVWMEGLMKAADDYRRASADDKEQARMSLYEHAMQAGQREQARFFGSASEADSYNEMRETKAYYDWQWNIGDAATPLRAWTERARRAYRPEPMGYVVLAKSGKKISEAVGRGMADALMQFRHSDSPERHQRVSMRPKGRE